MKILKLHLLITGILALTVALNPAYAHQNTKSISQAEKEYRLGKKHIADKKITSGITHLKRAAHKGHERAQYHLGILYYQQKQYKKARYWLRKRANAGEADAQYHYANTFRYALGTKEQTTIARRLYQKAAKQGHVQAQFELAKMFQHGIGARKNLKIAKKWYEEAANAGYEYAKQALKLLGYETSVAKASTKHIPKTEKVAKIAQKTQAEEAAPKKSDKLLASAFKGDAEQQYQLAMRYLLGYDMDTDLDQAIYWLNQAAERNHPLAEYQLANQYFKGKHIKQDIARAVHYFYRADQKGVKAARTALSIISAYGYENIVLAEMGERKVQFELALEYLTDQTKLDKSIALGWLESSARQSYSPALYRVGKMYENGDIYPKNYQKAFEAYSKAAELNHAGAQFALSKMYQNGMGVEKNPILANTWLNRAADQGLSAAQKALQFSEL